MATWCIIFPSFSIRKVIVPAGTDFGARRANSVACTVTTAGLNVAGDAGDAAIAGDAGDTGTTGVAGTAGAAPAPTTAASRRDRGANMAVRLGEKVRGR
jgi:hypothetical protein